jgi:hypothetical protein
VTNSVYCKSITQEKEAAKGIVEYWFGSPAWLQSEEQTHLQIGDLYQGKDGQWYLILTRKCSRIREDGLSLGLADDQGEIVTGKARLATHEEAAPLVAAQERKRAEREAKQAWAAEHTALIAAIKSHPEVTCPKHHSGELLLSTVNPYGGGDWFEIDETAKEIWYCRNNGYDGDDWSHNNVTTWGAGGIGWRIPYDSEIAQRIQALLPATAPEAAPTPQSTNEPTPATAPPSADHRKIAERVCALINDSKNYNAAVWCKADTHTRVYVTTTCRKHKDCGYVLVDSKGKIERHLTRQGGTIERLYWDATVNAALGGQIDA